jgi:signal transduction histidine kinase
MAIPGALRPLWSLLWIDYRKVEDDFRAELRDRAVLGLRIVSTVAIVMPTFAVAFLWSFGPADYQRGEGWLQVGLLEEVLALAIGALGLILSRTGWGRHHSRGLAAVIGLALGAISMTDMVNSAGYLSSVYAGSLLLVLVMVAVVPLRPLAMLGFGLALAGMFVASGFFDVTVGWPPPVGWMERLAILIAAALVGAGLRAAIARLHVQEYENRRALGESLEALQETQARLIASRRAASQGRLAAALTHEINSPLSVVASSGQLMERLVGVIAGKGEDSDMTTRLLADAKRAAETSREALGRIRRLVGRFERFIHLDAGSGELRPVDVNALLNDALSELSGSWGTRIHVIKEYAELPKVIGHPAGLSEVFGDVLDNAATAIEGEGEIRLTTRLDEGYVWVQIADTGRGMETEQLSEIFEPSFRVKDGRVSTSWGLYIWRQIIHEHGGEFRVSSEPNRGTEVEISLPAGVVESG